MNTMKGFDLGLLLLVVGCGGGSAQPAATPSTSTATATTVADTPNPTDDPAAPNGKPREVATGNTLTEFQKSRLLGHYSTYDGMSGFIFDRTGTPFMAKLDGVDKAMPLTESPSARGDKEYRSADRSTWIRVDEEGNVLYFQGPKQREGVRIKRDADANRLRYSSLSSPRGKPRSRTKCGGERTLYLRRGRESNPRLGLTPTPA